MLPNKIFEVRDHMTRISILAIGMFPHGNPEPVENAHLKTCGYPPFATEVMIVRLDGEGKVSVDPFSWGDRTYATAHAYIRDHFDDLPSGAVIDVRFILGETEAPAESEILPLTS